MIVGLDFLSEIKKKHGDFYTKISVGVWYVLPFFSGALFTIFHFVLFQFDGTYCINVIYCIMIKKKYRAYCQSSIHRVHCNPMSAEGATIWHLRGARIEFGNHKMQNSGIVMRTQYNHLLKRHVWIKKQKVRIVKTRRKNSQIEKYNPSNPSTPKKFQMDAP